MKIPIIAPVARQKATARGLRISGLAAAMLTATATASPIDPPMNVTSGLRFRIRHGAPAPSEIAIMPNHSTQPDPLAAECNVDILILVAAGLQTNMGTASST